MELIVYDNADRLRELLNTYVRDNENFTICIIDSTVYGYDAIVYEFVERHKNGEGMDNLKIIDKRPKVASQMSLKSNLGMTSNFISNDDSENWLRALMADRDNYFHPFGGLQGRNVYLLYRYDKEHLIDDDMKNYVANNRRLLKATYIDGTYLK